MLRAVCRAAVRGGVTAVQLRLKRAPDRSLYDLARRLVAELDVPLFVNDRVDVALAAGAAGVHLGPDDLSPELARGLSRQGSSSVPRWGRSWKSSADRWRITGVSDRCAPRPPRQLRGRRWGSMVLRRCCGARVCRPGVLIGGVSPADVAPAVLAGFAGVAVVSGILGSADVEGAARRYILDPEG